MHDARCLFFFTARYQLILAPVHILGKLNVAADQGCPLLLFPADSGRKRGANPSRGRSDGGSGDRSARLDVGELEERAAFYFTKGLADSSQKTYKSGENRYLRFCQSANWTPLPAAEATLCKFVLFLASDGLKHRTIKTYLSGVRFLHISRLDHTCRVRVTH